MASSINNSIGGAAGVAGTGLLKDTNTQKNANTGGPSFADEMLKTDANLSFKPADAQPKNPNSILSTEPTVPKPILKFSNHALERMNTRGISFTAEQITKIEQGMQKATEKGAKETLFLTDNSALIVNLKDSTVVTVMDKENLKENVFTKIDATILV